MRTEDERSDYGYYGRTKIYSKHHIPVNEVCKCGNRGTLKTEYDDTPGFRETTYLLECKKCGISVGGGSEILSTIKKWDAECRKLG